MIENTKNYKQFIFIDSNRLIDQKHVRFLMDEIENNNLLFANPICVNNEYEVIDGQHRLLAAKNLNVEIYYIRNEKLKKTDMIAMNKTKKIWSNAEYLHYYVSEQYAEYIKLQRFIEENNINANIAISLCDQWRSQKASKRFKAGEFIFNDSFGRELIEKAKNIIELVNNKLGFKLFTKSSSFMKALCIFLSTTSVDYRLLYERVERQLPKIHPQTNVRSYLEMFVDIYNFKARGRAISFDEIEI
ncbi:MAG TPA: ParB N-terminal domain-containing protein [Candidatus Sulfotelmatobacter sp.]|jgi:hypothetical protein|nr:ParB N-terminal domain-containing protein [Candidatus Sulfotelmatobacter sp.]